ncbi:hypothetical protein Pd630_LPD16072 (plasmid) [Rhodococcus opacus PD630]|nr:hypothetical protein Pd630_LPD16072 [Rhodococcus opacus PD630]
MHSSITAPRFDGHPTNDIEVPDPRLEGCAVSTVHGMHLPARRR